jgi:cytochrome c553
MSWPTREVMKDHFTAVVLVREALIAGNVELAKLIVTWLADPGADPGVPTWSPYIDRMRETATALVAATTIDEAGQATAELALACGGCHSAHDVSPPLAALEPPPAASGTRAHMLRHQGAAARMWNGLIGPSEASWQGGVADLAEAPLGEDEIFENASAAPWITELADEVHDLGARGGKAATWDQRAEIYGRLLATCATCHAAIP